MDRCGPARWTDAESVDPYEWRARDGAEFWCANQLMAVTVLHEGRTHLRIEPRTDGSPWLADAVSLANSLAEAKQRLWSY